jgi:hypothetical protein
MVGGRGGERDEEHRHAPRAQLRRGHGASAHHREVGRRVRLGDRRQVGAHADAVALERRVAVELRLSRSPDDSEPLGRAARQPLGHGDVDAARPLASAEDQKHVPHVLPEPPRAASLGPARPRNRGRVDGVAAVHVRDAGTMVERLLRLGEAEIHLACVAAEEARRDAGVAVLLLERHRHPPRRGVREERAGGVATGADHAGGRPLCGDGADAAERTTEAGDGAPVLPDARAVERVEVEQLEGEAGLRQHLALDPTARPDEERVGRRVQSADGAGDGEPRVEVPARTAAAEQDAHPYLAARATASGSVARSPTTRSRTLPMLTRIPVMASDSTRFERP